MRDMEFIKLFDEGHVFTQEELILECAWWNNNKKVVYHSTSFYVLGIETLRYRDARFFKLEITNIGNKNMVIQQPVEVKPNMGTESDTEWVLVNVVTVEGNEVERDGQENQ